MQVPYVIKPNAETLGAASLLPTYANKGDAGCDARANIATFETVHPGCRKLIPTGVYAAIPDGYEIQVRPRSGLALKHGISVINTPGCVDSSYRGEIGVILINHGDEPFHIYPGDKIAQFVLNKVETIEWEEVKQLPSSERGMNGYGSTGVRNG